jgi:hypothetical protein
MGERKNRINKRINKRLMSRYVTIGLNNKRVTGLCHMIETLGIYTRDV